MITISIDAAVLCHVVETGKHPTKLYLGRSEWEKLKAHAEQVCDFKMEADATGERRPEYRGSKIYRVDDESYIGVGI